MTERAAMQALDELHDLLEDLGCEQPQVDIERVLIEQPSGPPARYRVSVSFVHAHVGAHASAPTLLGALDQVLDAARREVPRVIENALGKAFDRQREAEEMQARLQRWLP